MAAMAPPASPLQDRLVFLVGARRSGTNWLQRILQAHPEVVSLPSETYVFHRGVRALADGFQHTNPGSPLTGTMFVERETFRAGVRELLDRALVDNLERLGASARFLIERTPWHVYDLELIARFYPDARVVHIVRDGRAVARSLLAMEWGPDTMAEAAEEWRSSVEAGRRGAAAFGDRYREVAYEGLLADPAAGIAELYGWLGVELDPGTVERLVLEAASEFNVDPAAPGVSAAKWRGALSAADLATFERVAGPALRAFGYEPASGGHGARAAIAARATAARAAARRARHPRAAVRTALERTRARRDMATLHRNHAVVERFQRAADTGRTEEALALMAPLVRIRIGGETAESAAAATPRASSSPRCAPTPPARHGTAGGRSTRRPAPSRSSASTSGPTAAAGRGRSC